MNTTIIKPKKSEVLTRVEKTGFKAWVRKQRTKQNAKELLGVNIKTLDRILLSGSASPETIEKIRAAISKQ